MKILNGRVNWMDGFGNDPVLEILVDKMPDRELLRYEEQDGCYYAELDGYVSFFYYIEPGQGYGGSNFHITMKDGTKRVLEGPWSSRAGVMNKKGFGPCIDVSMTDNPESYKRGYTFFSSACSLALVLEAFDIIDIGPGYGFKRTNLSTKKFPFPNGSKFDIQGHDNGSDICYTPVVMLPDGEIWVKNPIRICKSFNNELNGSQFDVVTR